MSFKKLAIVAAVCSLGASAVHAATFDVFIQSGNHQVTGTLATDFRGFLSPLDRLLEPDVDINLTVTGPGLTGTSSFTVTNANVLGFSLSGAEISDTSITLLRGNSSLFVFGERVSTSASAPVGIRGFCMTSESTGNGCVSNADRGESVVYEFSGLGVVTKSYFAQQPSGRLVIGTAQGAGMAPVPLPSAIGLLAVALGGLALFRRRRCIS